MTYCLFQKIKWRVSKVAQWEKSLAAIPSDLSLIPGAYNGGKRELIPTSSPLTSVSM